LNSIGIEDIATVFASEFLKEITTGKLKCKTTSLIVDNFTKMNYARRRKIIEKVLNKMEKEIC